MTALSHYALLGLSDTASLAEIKSAFRRLAKQCHPDCNLSPDAAARFRRLKYAYDVLSDPLARARYDAACHAGPGCYDDETERASQTHSRRHWYDAATPSPLSAWLAELNTRFVLTPAHLIAFFECVEASVRRMRRSESSA